MKKGDVKAYIRKFKTLRKSVDWPEENNGMITQFQCGLGMMHTHEIHKGMAPHPITLKDWYAVARNQWEAIKTEETHEEVGSNARAITSITPTPIIVRAIKVRTKIGDLKATCWQQALAKQQIITEGKRRNSGEIDRKETKQLRTSEPQLSNTPTTRNETMLEDAAGQIIWTRNVSVNRANAGPQNSLYVRVNFEHSQGREVACALIDSGATENFVNI